VSENRTEDAVALFSSYVEEFAGYYQNRAEFEERFKLWSGLLDKYHVPGGLSLDLGCGTGVFSLYLAAKSGRVVGVDGSAEMLSFCERQRQARALENVRFVQGRLPDIDVSGLQNADLIISSSVLEYVEDLDRTLALIAGLLKPQAALIVSMPNVHSLSRTYERLRYAVTGHPTIYQYIRHFTSPRQMQRRVQRYGLKLQSAQYYTHYTKGAQITRALRFPEICTEDLFVVVFRKN
jgi:2-polyprenyl-6-hydroxyphenyl methylase/3-demethylubiquinone-9 3-methyltransferase